MTDSSLIATLTHATAYRYVSDAFGRDPAAYDSVGDFLDMCEAAFGERPALASASGVAYDDQQWEGGDYYHEGSLVLEEFSVWAVDDPAGGRWWPGAETAAEIDASDDPEATSLRICQEQPMRGEWRS